jgi:hypothetical protein
VVSIPRASLCFEVHDDILLLVHAREAPNDAEWSGFVTEAESEMMRQPRPVLVVSEGGLPSASQRTALNQKPHGVLTAVLIDSCVAEGSWFEGGVRAFPKDEQGMIQALRYLGVDISRDEAIFDAIGGMLSAVTGGVPP